jgi:hypothetical protein
MKSFADLFLKWPKRPEFDILTRSIVWIPYPATLCIIVMFIIQLSSYAQSSDCVKVYVLDFNRTLLTEWVADPNYVRVNYDYLIQFRGSSALSELDEAYSNINYTGRAKERRQDTSGCRVVIDWVRGGRIHETLVLDKSYRMKHDVVYDSYDTWDMDCGFIRFLHSFVPERILPISPCR